MPETLTQQQKRRRGDAILWAVLFLTAFATVDVASLALARQTWQRLAPQAGRALINAQPVGTSAHGAVLRTSTYRWNADQVRYVAPNGKTIRPDAVKQQVATFNERAAGEARVLTARMTSGAITVGEWQMAAATLVKSVHIASYVVGRGGIAALLPLDFETMRSMLTYQATKLQAFARQVGVDPLIESKATLSDAAAESRLPLYMAAANGSFEHGHKGAWLELAGTGVRVMVKNVLAEGKEHCFHDLKQPDVPDCIGETKRGYVDINDISMPGDRLCTVHCFCRLSYDRRAR